MGFLEKVNNWENLGERWGQCTLCGQRYTPKSQLVKYQGKYYHKSCFEFRWNRQFLDDQILEPPEDEPEYNE